MATDPERLELTQEEIARLKKIAQEDMRMEWFWATLRKWGSWGAAVLAGVVAFRQDLAAIWQWLVK